jgi:hypothetical protein
MPHEPDAGLVKRGLVLLILMLLVVGTVLFILLQGRPSATRPDSARPEELAWSIALPSAPFPASVSWGALVPLSEQVPSPAGWEVRYNAVATLARRGSDHVPWSQFREMLDVERMTVNARERLQEGQDPPEASARAMVVAALKAVAEWHTRRREANRLDVPDGLPAVYELVNRLAQGPYADVRDQADRTRSTFFPM